MQLDRMRWYSFPRRIRWCILAVVLLFCVLTTASNRLLRKRENGKHHHRGRQNTTCYTFTAPSYINLTAQFMKFSLHAAITIKSYSFLIDTGYFFRHFVYYNTGYLTSWTLLGSFGSNGTTNAPISPSDPSWMLVDTQQNIDFSTPQTFLNPGLFTYPFVNGTSMYYQHFGLISTLIPPMNPLEALKPYIIPVIQIDFCS